MALDGLKGGRTDAVRVAVVVLQSVVVIRAGLKIVRDNPRAVIRKNAQKNSVQEELGLTMYTPAWCGGRRGVRLVGLPRGGVIDESPFTAVVVVADDKVKGCEHGQEKAFELQESMTPVGGPVGVSERGPLGLGREGEGLVLRHSRSRMCTLRRAGPRRRSLVVARSLCGRKEKRSFGTSRANWESSMRAGPTTLGAVLDAGGHSGPRWTGDAWLARRRCYSTARRDRVIA